MMKKILFLHGFYASGQCIPAMTLREAFEGRLCTREKGKWHLPEDWEAQDKALDAEIAEDFYAD